MPKKPSSPTPISHTRHADKRTNIPTEELRGFVADEERAPRTVLYPRDPSLDPQLVERQGCPGSAGPGSARRADLHSGEDFAAGYH